MVTSMATHRFTRAEYQKMAAVLDPEWRVELIEGQIVEMSPQDPIHSNHIGYLNGLFNRVFGPTHNVRIGLPMGLGEHSEPEPDLALISHALADQIRQQRLHPSTADLIIEVSNTSLTYDRREKASLYARHGLPEYWIVNIPQRCLDVYRQPVEDPSAAFGWSYAETRRLTEGFVKPAFSELELPVAELLSD